MSTLERHWIGNIIMKRPAQEDKKIKQKIRKYKLLEERNEIVKEIRNKLHPLPEGLLQEFVE